MQLSFVKMTQNRRMPSSKIQRPKALVRTDVSEVVIITIIRVARIASQHASVVSYCQRS
jgi:hypothetical protein